TARARDRLELRPSRLVGEPSRWQGAYGKVRQPDRLPLPAARGPRDVLVQRSNDADWKDDRRAGSGGKRCAERAQPATSRRRARPLGTLVGPVRRASIREETMFGFFKRSAGSRGTGA